jgi:hypothetical protein
MARAVVGDSDTQFFSSGSDGLNDRGWNWCRWLGWVRGGRLDLLAGGLGRLRFPNFPRLAEVFAHLLGDVLLLFRLLCPILGICDRQAVIVHGQPVGHHGEQESENDEDY